MPGSAGASMRPVLRPMCPARARAGTGPGGPTVGASPGGTVRREPSRADCDGVGEHRGPHVVRSVHDDRRHDTLVARPPARRQLGDHLAVELEAVVGRRAGGDEACLCRCGELEMDVARCVRAETASATRCALVANPRRTPVKSGSGMATTSYTSAHGNSTRSSSAPVPMSRKAMQPADSRRGRPGGGRSGPRRRGRFRSRGRGCSGRPRSGAGAAPYRRTGPPRRDRTRTTTTRRRPIAGCGAGPTRR